VTDCGHMFCWACILECKKRLNACPICRGSLRHLTRRVYEVDKVMEEYFNQAQASEAERQLYLEVKEKRIGGLIKSMESWKKSYFRVIRDEWGLLCFRFRSKGIVRGTTATFRRLFGQIENKMGISLPIPTKAWIAFGGGALLGFLLDRYAAGDYHMVKFVHFWWTHILTGIYNYQQIRNNGTGK